ncbi:type II toxin-antitoxin system RelB/DinJ family antitoxin [Geminocystis sp. CENA526]|uniref:type II toxin-antitoxin system RelB/DinJ family antitoxin n=1 Tax=Geminocystis sp. CENA526 TaxID=1355871 RepID=UPI003D6E16BA
MSKNAVIKAVTDAELKTKVEQIFIDIGMTPDEAVNLFYTQVLLHNGLPFDLKIPNQITISAIDDTNKKIGETFNSVDQLFEDLND